MAKIPPHPPETEEDGTRAEALRRSRVRLLSLAPPAPIRGSSASQNNTPATTESTAPAKSTTAAYDRTYVANSGDE